VFLKPRELLIHHCVVPLLPQEKATVIPRFGNGLKKDILKLFQSKKKYTTMHRLLQKASSLLAFSCGRRGTTPVVDEEST